MKRIIIWSFISCLVFLGGCTNTNGGAGQIRQGADDAGYVSERETAIDGLDIISNGLEPQPSFEVIKPVLIKNDAFKNIENKIQTEIEHGFPGAVLLVARDGEIIYFNAFGYSKKYNENVLLEQPVPMQLNTLFDLASLTKIYSTTFAIMKLYDEGRLGLDDYIY